MSRVFTMKRMNAVQIGSGVTADVLQGCSEGQRAFTDRL